MKYFFVWRVLFFRKIFSGGRRKKINFCLCVCVCVCVFLMSRPSRNMHKDGVLILERTDSNCCGLEHKIVRFSTILDSLGRLH